MITAAMWCVITGLLWTGVGIYFSHINKRNINPVTFNLCCAIFLFFICSGTVKWASLAKADWQVRNFPVFLLVMLAAGIAIAGGMLLMIKAMKIGKPDIVWSVCQSSLVVPFSLAIILNGEKLTLWNLLGIVAILSGIILFGSQRNPGSRSGNGQPAKGWFVLTLVAFAVTGAGQYCFSIPSFWSGWSDLYGLRIPLQSIGGLVLFSGLLASPDISRPSGSIWLYGLTFAVLTYAGRFTLYKSIDALAALNMISIAYPVCLGLSIVGFVTYHSFSQKAISKKSIITVIILIGGLILIGCR